MLLRGGPANSGTKLPKREPDGPWTCSQGHDNKAAWVRCMTSGCNEKRR